MKFFSVTILLACLLSLGACGGSSGEPPQPVPEADEQVEQEPGPEIAPAPQPDPEPDPVPDPQPDPAPPPSPVPDPVPPPEPQPEPEPQPDPQPVPKPGIIKDVGISHSGGTRSGTIYLPANFDAQKEYPAALLLHGLGGNGLWMVNEFKSLADEKGIILVAPDGFSRPNPFGAGATYYFNPNHINAEPQDYSFAMLCLQKVMEEYSIDENHILVAGMSMGAPATLFFAGHDAVFTHAGMLHGVRWNLDKEKANDVTNLLWFDWEQTPTGVNRPLFWYSSSVDDWVTNYDSMSIQGLSVEQDLAYIENAGFNVTHKFDYPGGHFMTPEEKSDLINWFLE